MVDSKVWHGTDGTSGRHGRTARHGRPGRLAQHGVVLTALDKKQRRTHVSLRKQTRKHSYADMQAQVYRTFAGISYL
jgi:hypothetical protein